MPSYETSADIFTRLRVFEWPKVSSNNIKTRKKASLCLNALNNIHGGMKERQLLDMKNHSVTGGLSSFAQLYHNKRCVVLKGRKSAGY